MATTSKGEAIISMWAIIELFFIMILAFVIFGWFGISIDQVFSVYGANMFTWLTSALNGFASWMVQVTLQVGNAISNFLIAIFCGISPTC